MTLVMVLNLNQKRSSLPNSLLTVRLLLMLPMPLLPLPLKLLLKLLLMPPLLVPLLVSLIQHYSELMVPLSLTVEPLVLEVSDVDVD